MSLHDGPVYRGHLYVRGYDDKEFESLNFTKWIQFLSKNGIKDMSVHTAHMGYVGIPSNIFNCCSLQCLHLFICQLEPSLGFSGFCKLVSLELLYCKLPDSLLESMISNSPLLEELVFVDPKPREPFAVDAPNLKSLKLFNFEPTPLCLVEYPKLTTALICSALMIPANKFTASALSKFSSFLPRIENLSIHWTTLASLGAGGVPFRLPTPFKYLEHLELDEFDVVSLDPIYSAFCMLRSSPILRSLYISVSRKNSNQNAAASVIIQYIDAQASEGDLSSVRTVTIWQIEGKDFEYSLIRTILMCCPKLETMKIITFPFGDMEVEAQVRLNLFNLPRSSILEVVRGMHFDDE
uniref:F-box/LRR-repeat protein 15/At3g58940/PEG3-like LRR domain-containing protein n=1 Tax=Kalanchoe fedtschenkoi TaxID=63787 RepID=A0A7N0T0Q9_KALFE